MSAKRILAAVALAALALPLAAQGPFGPRMPGMSGIWHPVVGTGGAYEMTDHDGKKMQMELTLVGQEDVNGKPGYWMETAMADPRSGGTMYMKTLLTPDAGNGVTGTRMIMQMAGQDPIEMDMNMPGMGRGRGGSSAPTDVRQQGEVVGTESVTVPGGTFVCQHFRMKDGSADVWISDKVTPWGLVKMQGTDSSMVLIKVITDAKDHITGTPKKFDPSIFLRGGAGRGQ